VLALLPDWVHPVAEYMAKEGLKGTARVAAFSLLASVLVGIPLGKIGRASCRERV